MADAARGRTQTETMLSTWGDDDDDEYAHVAPYRNAFSGRDTTPNSFHCHATDKRWKIHVHDEGKPVDAGDEDEHGVITLVERMIKDGWDKVKKMTIFEESMKKSMRIEELMEPGLEGELRPLDLSVPDERHNDMDAVYGSDPPKFHIPSIAQLQKWDADGRPVPGGSHAAGSEVDHSHRNIKHPDDPLGLVADKLGRAIADQRFCKITGKRLEPCFIHVYSLGHSSVMKLMDKGMEAIGVGAFHCAVECYGQEWSYGYNDDPDDGSGQFVGPPKYCAMHEYKESHYIGDSTISMEEWDNWLMIMNTIAYKKEDPLDEAFPKRAPRHGETADSFYGDKLHHFHRDPPQLQPLTAAALDEKNEQYWITYEAVNGNKVTARVGFWGDEYTLLSNNCCFYSDHVLKILCKTPLPRWVFCLAKMGMGLEQGAHYVHDELAAGVHSLEHLWKAARSAVKKKKVKKSGGGGGGGCCGSRTKNDDY